MTSLSNLIILALSTGQENLLVQPMSFKTETIRQSPSLGVKVKNSRTSNEYNFSPKNK